MKSTTAARASAYVDKVVRSSSSHLSVAKLYAAKTAITLAGLLNDRVLPFFEQQQVPLLRILTDRGTESCGRYDEHPYQLFLAVNDVDHTKTKEKSPQNGICERFHKTVLREFYQVAFRKRLYASLSSCRPTSTRGWSRTMSSGRTKARCAVVERPGRRSRMDAGWPRRR